MANLKVEIKGRYGEMRTELEYEIRDELLKLTTKYAVKINEV